MKKTGKMLAISVIIAMLAIVVLPLTKVQASSVTICPNAWEDEYVSADTNIEEYIAAKKAKFIQDCEDSGFTQEELGNIDDFFNDSLQVDNYKYIVFQGASGDETSTTIGCTQYRVFKLKKQISSVTVTIVPPKAGDKVESESYVSEWDGQTYQMPKQKPTVQLENNAKYGFEERAYITAYPSERDNIEEATAPFFGTFVEGEEYCVEVALMPNDADYEFADEVTLNLSGATGYELAEWNGPYSFMLYAKVKATAASTGSDTTNPTDDETTDGKQ